MHFLVTGHTGFKGSWLTLMLGAAGHTVSGYSLDPEPGSLFERAGLSDHMESDIRGDIRDFDSLSSAFAVVRPDAVFHLAAQPLVRDSYASPRLTVETNVVGTMNVIDAARAADSVAGMVVVTTDKVYRNVNQVAGYLEGDALGGHDPYSASKAMADILTQSWISSFPGFPISIARAGNVIGGGDVCKDRLVPDLMAGFASDSVVPLRYPAAVRPWQHVLDCLNGYTMLMDRTLTDSLPFVDWNFGPGPQSFKTVAQVADLAASYWGAGARWSDMGGDHPHEAGLLALDASRARGELGWQDRLDFLSAVRWTVDWYKNTDSGQDPLALTTSQISDFYSLSPA
jgi:CDP-glucose 4,6-dehydratase